MGQLTDLARHGDRVAVIDADLAQTVTYGDLERRAERFGARFDTSEKKLVMMFASNTLGFVVAYTWALSRGHAICLLDAELSHEQKQTLVELYRPSLILDCRTANWTQFLPGNHVPCDEPDLAVSRSKGNDDAAVHPDLGVLLSTSGSTGSAKLVRLSTKAVVENARSIAEALAIDPDEKTLTSLPPSYSYGLSVLNSYAMAGATMVLTQHGIVSREFWSTFSKEACTTFAGVPFAYEALVRLRIDERPPKSMRIMTQAGGRLAVPVAERFHAAMSKRGGVFYVMYGQTEATARMSYLPSADFPEKKGSCGKAIPRGSFHIDEGTGEVVYRGPNVMMGYAQSASDLSRGDDYDGVLATGDLGRLDQDGFLTLTGRLKRITKIHGSRFNLDEIEAVAAREQNAIAIGLDETVILFLTSPPASADALREKVASSLGLHPDDFAVRVVPEIPTTPNGKPDYIKLGQWASS